MCLSVTVTEEWRQKSLLAKAQYSLGPWGGGVHSCSEVESKIPRISASPSSPDMCHGALPAPEQQLWIGQLLSYVGRPRR